MSHPQDPRDPRLWQTQPGAYPAAPRSTPGISVTRIVVIAGAVVVGVLGGIVALVAVLGGAANGGRPMVQVEPPARIGTPVRDGTFEFTVTRTETATHLGGQVLGVGAKGVFVIVRLHVTNIGREAQYVDDDDQKLLDDQGREYIPDSSAAFWVEDSGDLSERLNPGLAADGVVVFDVPRGVKMVAIELHDSVFSRGVRVSLG